MDIVLVIVVCLILNAFFAAYEMAFVSIQRAELRNLARNGNKHARILLKLRENPERTLSVIQVGITLVGAVAAAIGGAGAGDTLEPYFIKEYGMKESVAEVLSVVLVVIPITYLSVVVGELVPKTLALRNPRRIVLVGARFLLIADRIFSPAVTVLEWSTKTLLAIFFKKSKPVSTSGEDATTIAIDNLSPVHQTFMLNMAGIENKKIRDIFVPWQQVISVQNDSTHEEITQTVISSGHTRLPVFEGGLVVGVLHTKEFMTLRESGEKTWQGLIRPVLKIREDGSALGVMRLLQERRTHMAVVMAKTGESLGIITLEDILEEVVGDIFDEDDDGRVRKVYAARSRSRLLRS